MPTLVRSRKFARLFAFASVILCSFAACDAGNRVYSPGQQVNGEGYGGRAVWINNVTASASPIVAGTILTMSGGNFGAGLSITVDGVACAPVTVVSSAELTCVMTGGIGSISRVELVDSTGAIAVYTPPVDPGDSVPATCVPGSVAFAGGVGTVADPYLITNVAQLFHVSCNLDKAFRLTRDIDLAGKNFPIIEGPFEGDFDGNNHVISNWQMAASRNYVGFFAQVIGGSIRSLNLVNAAVSGGTATGILAGGVIGTISNCSTSGTVEGGMGTGGLVGILASSGTVRDSSSSAAVTGGHSAGGLIGLNNVGNIILSHASGPVSGVNSVGGLTGASWGIITASFATGSASGVNDVGGLTGKNEVGRVISDSYATGRATGQLRVGGLVGENRGRILRSYSLGQPTGTGSVGGLIGLNSSATATPQELAACYFDQETALTAASDGGTPKTTAEMKSEPTYSGWDFATVWTVSPGSYPTLR